MIEDVKFTINISQKTLSDERIAEKSSASVLMKQSDVLKSKESI